MPPPVTPAEPGFKFYGTKHLHTEEGMVGWRQVSDNDEVKPNDIIWYNKTHILHGRTGQFAHLMIGAGNWFRMDPLIYVGGSIGEKTFAAFLNSKHIQAKDIIDVLRDVHADSIRSYQSHGSIVAKRTYSIWRPRLIIPKRPWQMIPLPLP